MITKFELFESLNIGEPKFYDYVICSTDSPEIKEFVSNHIGQITRVFHEGETKPVGYDDFMVEYGRENIPEKLNTFYFLHGNHSGWRGFKREDIIYWSKDKEDLEKIIQKKLAINRFDL